MADAATPAPAKKAIYKRWWFILSAVILVLTLAIVWVWMQHLVPHQVLRSYDDMSHLVVDSTSTYDYSMAFIEFDDQGFFWDEHQLEAAVEHIRMVAENRGAVIIAFVHGWNHNASEGDNNVACFQEMLKAASLIQRANHPGRPDEARAVVGVYLGWRGLVFDPVDLNVALTFWNRIETADRIGVRGDMLRTLLAMRELRYTVGAEKSRLIVAGHSMGARALFSALSPFYKEYVFRPDSSSDTHPQWDVSTSFGDLVVLINPAFSATDYNSIDEASQNAYSDHLLEMEPNLVIISSRSDTATRDRYPQAQMFSSRLQSFQSDSQRALLSTTVGNYEPFFTHRLTVASGTVPAFERTGSECPYLKAEELDVVRGSARVADTADLFKYDRINHFDETGEFGDNNLVYTTALERVNPDGPRRGPFMVVSADSAIIPGHNEIFEPPFIDFLVRLVNKKALAWPQTE